MDGQVALSALPPGSILEELFLPGIPETVNLHFKFEVGIHCCAVVYSELPRTMILIRSSLRQCTVSLNDKLAATMMRNL
jgi:hypothetical protein